MIKFENTEVVGWEAAIRGMRNPMNSWEKSDSTCFGCMDSGEKRFRDCETCDDYIGPNDRDLMMRLAKAGSEHAKYRRMIVCYVDITAPLYWWKEFDTYKVGTVANSCSTMHRIAEKEFTLEDFSCEHLLATESFPINDDVVYECGSFLSDFCPDDFVRAKFAETPAMNTFVWPMDILHMEIKMLNLARSCYVNTNDKRYWWQMIQLLPSSYNQRRTVMLNYEVLANIYRQRQGHKLDEWRVGFMKWIESLPYSEIITGKEK